MAEKHKSDRQASQEGMDILASMTGMGSISRAPTGVGQNWMENELSDDPVFDVPTGNPASGQGRKSAAPQDPMRAVEEMRQGREEGSVPMDAHKKRITRMGRKNQALSDENRELHEQLARLESKQASSTRMSKINERMEQLGDEYSPEAREAALLDVVDELVNSRVAQALGDVDRRFQNMEAFRGLSEEQMDAVEDAREAYPQINDPGKLLKLAQLEEPDVFLGMQSHGGSAYVGNPGRGSENEQRSDDPVSSEEIRKAMYENPDSAMDLGPYLIKAEMDEQNPGIHGSGHAPTRRGQIR